MPVTHPLDPLTKEEIEIFGATAKAHFAKDAIVRLVYITVIEPPKEQVLKFLGIGATPDEKVEKLNQLPPRRAETLVLNLTDKNVHEVHMTLSGTDKATVDSDKVLPPGVFPMYSMEDMRKVREIVENDPQVIKAAADVGVKKEHICCESWTPNWDPRANPNHRYAQGLIYVRTDPHRNLYGYPLDFAVLVDLFEEKVVAIDYPAKAKNTTKTPKDQLTMESTGSRMPTPLGEDSLKASGRERFEPVLSVSKEYLPEYILKDDPNFKYREPVKPLNIVQPEGVSFTVEGHRIKWENWDFHVSVNDREGLHINTVQYYDAVEDKVRPLFYRLSCPELVVPYADPAWPYPRKSAFDAGEAGFGRAINELELGCDCVGTIKYFDYETINSAFESTTKKNVVCIHEEDDGFLWKHSDMRPGGRSHTVRSRKLIVQSTCTLGNYEYSFNYIFRQDASIEVEVKLTGILNTVAGDVDESSPFAVTVAEGVLAQLHQHMFSIYVNPMVDGTENSVLESEVVPLEDPVGSEANFAGNAFYAKSTIPETTDAFPRDPAYERNRTWTFVNLNKTHPVSGKPVGYKALPMNPIPPLLPKKGSVPEKRGTFASHAIWVAPHADDQLYPSGKYNAQSTGTLTDTVDNWVKGSKPIKQKDLSAWVTLGVTHVPRPEDFPVMPKEWVSLLLKPFSFFKANPANDVPPSQNKKSVLVDDAKCCVEDENCVGDKCCKKGDNCCSGDACCPGEKCCGGVKCCSGDKCNCSGK